MPLRVAFQGVPGAFSHAAALVLIPGADYVPFETFAQVFAALEGGDCDRAVTPVENSIAGPVPEVQARLMRPGLEVIGEATRRIELALMVMPGVELRELTTVASHPIALKQCARSMAALGLASREVFDTAGAARMVAEAGEREVAAVAARIAAELYGLTVLRPNMEDEETNRTRFLALKRA